MKKMFLLSAFAISLLCGCGESIDSKAEKLLQQATLAYGTGDYSNAKIFIDSIRTAYPTAVTARRGALDLMREVEMAEQQRSLDYCNETIEKLSAERDKMLAEFDYEKDGRYQDEASYIVSSQALRLNVFNNLLRARVTESGTAYITSIYRGKKIAHRSVKVSSGDNYASCDKPFMSHTYRNLGVNNERLDFIYGEDGGIADFIASASGDVLVELSGDNGNFKYTLRRDDIKAITKAVKLSKLLKSIDEHKSMAAEAQRHLDFVKKSRERFSNDSIKTEK